MANPTTPVRIPLAGELPYDTFKNPTTYFQLNVPTVVADTVAINAGSIVMQSPEAFVGNRTNGVNAVTVGGTITAGNTVTLTFAHPIFGANISETYTVVAGDTTESIAAELASLINSDATLNGNYGVWATTNSTEVISVNWPGPLAAFATLSESTSGGATETLTLSPTNGTLPGSAGIAIAISNFIYSYRGQSTTYMAGQPVNVSYDILTSMVNDKAPLV